MKWDVKIAVYGTLTYVFYGASYLFSTGDFVVPYPILVYFLPILAIVFLLTTPFSKYSLFNLLFPLLPCLDLIYLYHTKLGELSTLVIIVSWMLLGFLMWLDNQLNMIVGRIFAASLLLAPLLLLANFYLTISYVLLVFTMGIVMLKGDEEKARLSPVAKRGVVFLLFNIALYLITIISHLLNNN